MTTKILIPLANGFEEIEAITMIDVLRRANLEVVVAGMTEGPIEASRKTRHLPDALLEDVWRVDFDMIVLPGGQPGTNHLKSDLRVKECLIRHFQQGKWIAAICAAPIVLQEVGILKGKHVTSHPSVREQFTSSIYSEERVVVDGKIVTSRGPGTAAEFSFKLVELLCGKEFAEKLNVPFLARL
jgi:protein deglycase